MALEQNLLLSELQKMFSEEAVTTGLGGSLTVQVSKEMVVESLRQLKNRSDFGLDCLSDVTAVDVGNMFTVVYRLQSLSHEFDTVVKTEITRQDPVVDSVAGLWSSALFAEREVADMFGIRFDGHPDPRPLLAPEEGFPFFPLRKDFKLAGR
jgi:NADH-quinone oxidoreductase subunit C